MSGPIRAWAPVPAWWVPVWVTLDGTSGCTDALETAVAAMVRAGLPTSDEIARELCLDAALVESAVAGLIAAGRLEASEAGLAELPEPGADLPPQARAGYVAWDASARRPLLQVWLDREPPQPRDVNLERWRLAPWYEPSDYPRRPTEPELDGLLRVLPTAGDLRLMEPVGGGISSSDGSPVRTVRRRSGRSRRLPIWAPVEHRVTGPVVWRPSLFPVPEVDTELDPGGFDALERAVTEDVRTVLREAAAECRDRIAPGVVRSAGFESVNDLRDAARVEAAQELRGVADMPAWRLLAKCVEEAIIDGHISAAVGGDWRRAPRAWGDVLEYLVRVLAAQLEPSVMKLGARKLGGEEHRRLRPLLLDSTDRVVQTAGNGTALQKLQEAYRQGTVSIGTGVLALGACVALNPDVQRAFRTLCDDTPGIFHELDVAKDERNSVVHPRPGETEIGVAGHRARILLLCRTLPRMTLPDAG